MAERPLYTLYKNLKAQNYDVPNDYNKFESALTRDGKSGADNRHAIYENLKAQNFDVPDTYERFYTALFEPRSKTSSRAKGGSVPMSAADRARFSAGAAAISASAKQIVNNAGRYSRLKQRKQKQQKDFGRVNLGTHQTPYGGDANNVVKDEFAYNPETGKAGAYVTSDNENVYSQNDAEQKQAILDEQNNAYQQAVDTGEIPSVFDVRNKNGNYDLQENIGKNGTYLTEEGAQKQFDKKLADAYARKKEIEALIDEDNRQHGNPLLSYGASIGAGNGRTAEQSDYRNKLATSLSLITEQIGALEAVKQYPTSSWGEDALKALDNTAFTAKTWDFGLTDFAIMGQMERIKTKMDNNIPLSGSDKILLKSKLGADAAAALEDEKMGNVYRWTKIAGQSLPFMADFFLTGGYGGITKGISRGTLKFAAKRGMGKVSAAILKNTGIVAGDVIGSYAMAGTEQALKTGADIMQRHLGNLYQDEKGDYKFGTFDENGNLLHEGGESIGTALYKGMTSAMVENYTEKLFGHNYGIKKGAVNFMEKHGMNASAEFFKNIGKSGWYTNSKKWMEKFGINGFAEEVMEEEIGIPLHALLDGEGKVSDLLDAKQQLDIIGGMAISVGSMYAMGAGSRPVKGIYNRAQYYRFRNKVNVADSDAQNLMGDNWADIKDKIDNATNEQMGGVLADILRQRDTMTKEQINAAVNYGVNLMKMRGYNIAKTAEMNAKEITNEPTTPEEQHQADIDNAYSEGHDADDADKHDIQLEQNDKANELAAMLHITPEQLHDMADEDLEAMNGQDDKLDQAIYDYQVSTAKYQGVMDGAQDEVDMAAHQAAMETDNMTDLSRGTVRKATFKATGGLEDYEVYIISGNIATHDDGSIDVGNSDDMIIYYDPTTGRKEHADAMMFANLIEELPAADVKAQAINDAKENAIKKIAGIIDGTVNVGSQFSVTDADGTEHTYEVLADNGDGTAMITIDGNVPTELVKGENVQIPYSFANLQQMKDLEDQKRLEAAKDEREQMEKERDAQQTQETEQTQPSFDFNQILNDNGNVVLVDVLDKDGNTKYPDSRLFLIRDAGAKAKVVELKSDGTIVPHAVNKEDVATISSMSLDEYKQAFADSSMIEDNSGENRGEKEVEAPTIEGETAAPESAETPATEQTPAAPAITLEDGTIVPMLEDGNPDFSKLTAEQTAELYDSQFGEDADSIVSGYVSDAKKALDKANNMTVKGKTFVEQKAAKQAKEKAIADAQAAYDSAIAIRDAYNERQLAKVEDTADGRKNLIEKARRKFARLKSSIKDDAEAVAQIYKETVGSLLHRLYDGTGIDVTDTNPLTAEEYVASNLSAHTLNYEGTETSKGVKQETGLSREDFAKTQLLAADGKGTTIDNLVHSLWENRPSNLDSLNTQDIRNALIGVLTSGFKASEARSYVENIRIAQAEKLIEEERTAAENAAYYEQQKAKEEEEKKKAELEKKAEEEKKKAEENIDLPAIDKQGEPINNNIIELAKWAKKQGLEIDPTSKLNSYADLFLMCKDGFGVSTLVPDEGKNINQVIYFPDNAEVVEQLGKLQEEFNAGRDLNHSSNIDSEITEGATFYDAATAKEFRDFANEQTKFPDTLREGSNAIEAPEDATDEKPLGEQLDETNLPFSAKENGKQQTTAERAADVEKNKVDDMKVVDNIVGQKTRKAFERLAKMMGANIQWQYSDKLGNGWIQETKDADGNVRRTIFITLDSSITEGAQFIFGHEMTHQIKSLNPAAYNELTQLVLDTYGSDAFDKAVDETMQRYSDAGFSGRNREYYAEEVVADAVGEMIRDLNLAHTLAMKMSHPLLAAIHEILQKIKLAFFGTEYSDVTKNIIRSIEQAYVKTAKGEVTNSDTGEDVSYSLRQKPEPKKKGIGYKVFVLKDGKLYPPMVANPDGAATPVGVWLDADAAPIAGESKTGRPQVKQGGKGTQGGSGKLAYRPGWHLGVVPYAIQFNRKDADGNKTLFPKNFVFAEVEYAADVDYQEEARQEGINPSGKYQHSLAGLKHLPTDGYYMYRTNPNPETDPWVITGAMKVNRILTRAEQAELVKNAGREPQQIQEGDIVTDDVVNSINQEIADAPKFSLKVYHGSGADFTEKTKFSLRLKSAIEETETNPSDAQKKSNNYKKGHIKFGGYDYTIENPKGSTRSGKDANGKEWKVTMHDTYGYIRGKFGKDGDHLDMFINDKADLDNWDGDVFVVDQVNPDGSFDEHKVMYGYDSMDDAEKAYLANYSKGWQGLGNITGASKAEFDKWLDTSNRKLKPFADYANVKFSQAQSVTEPRYSLDDIKPVGVGAFGNIYNQFRGKAKAAIEFLKKVRGGEAVGALHHKDIGDIDLVWGKEGTGHSDGYGLSKLVKYHPEVLDNLQEILNDMRVVSSSKNRVNLESETHKAGVRLTWDGERKSWLLTAFKKETSASDKRTDTAATSLEGDTALSQTEGSAAKIDNSSETSKKNGEKFSLKDDEYLKAVEDGDMEKAQKMVNEAAMAAGYSTDSSYQGTSAFNGSAPWGNGYFLTKEERKEAWDNDEYDGDQTLGDYIHRGIDAMNLDFIALDPRNYRAADPMRKEAIDNVRNAIQKKSETITMYRSVPSDVKEGSFRNGDWVTPSRSYAVDNAKVHGWGNNYNIIEQKVPVDEIWWDGNDIAEWGYGREEDYVNDTDFAYKNTKNNRKLLDAVTYDDNGNVIPLSQRFNENNADVRYSLKDEKTMFGMHNISVDKLRKAIKQGGFAAPSMGVVDSKNGIYSGYGEITLIPKAEKIAKRTGKNIGTYTADAWTPIYPPVEKNFGGNGSDVAYNDIESVPKEMQNLTRNAINSFMDGREANGLAYLYLQEKGKAPELVHVEGKYPKELHDEVKGILGKLNGIYNTTDEQKEKLLDLFIREVYDGNREEFDNDIKNFIKKDEEFIKKRPNSNIAKNKQLDVDWMKEHGYDYGALSRFVDGILRDAETSGKVNENATMKAAQQYIQDNSMKEDFDSWKEKLNDRYNVEEVIFAGYKPDGNRKYLPNTVENAVKVMKQDGKNASVGSASFSHFVASILKPMGTLDQIRKKKGNLTGNYEDVEKFQEKWQPVYDELADKMQPDAEPFESYGMDRLEEAVTQKNPKKYAKDEYGVDLTDEDIDKLNELIDAVKNEKPSIYFETKFMRPYGLDEFEKAIVPNDTPSDVVDALKMAGIDVSSYERGNAEDRQKVTMDAINSSDNIRFSLAGERGAAAADKAEERTARMDNLSVARKMEEEKKDAKAIKMATGWERGADGKWRYEMPDVVLRDPKEWVNKKTLTLSDIVEKPNDLFKEYPELFDAYPELKDMKILKGRAKSGGVFYNNAITLNLGDIREAIKYDMDTHYKLANNSLKKTLVHEIQHYIQDKEGFAQGGNSEMIIDKNALDAIAKLRAEKDAVAKEFYAMSPDEQQRRKYEINNRYNDLTKQIERLEKSSRIGYDGYNRLSGEVEARNVSARLNMTPEERRKSLAESTEDVARKDQIFLGVGDVSFSLRDMADGKESGAADMAEDLKSLNTPDEVDDAIKTAIDDMPSGWKMANKKMIHIAQAQGENRKAEIAGEEPKFSLKDGSLIKAGTYFSGGGLVEEGLKGIIDPVVAVEYDEKISGVYRNNFGQHIVTADVRDVDPKELVKQIDGEVEYFHASPVCKNYSQAKSNHAEVELDKETAASTAEFINAIKPKVVTIENVKGYKDSEAMKIITDALDSNGYTWDADVYNAADYGGYTNRERLIVRAVRDGKLPDKPKKMARKSGWYEAVADIIPTLTEKKNGVAPWMDIRLKADGIDWRNIDKPLYVMGSAYADGKIPHAFADELLPTLRTKSGDVIVMPGGKVYRAMGRVLARVSGVSDDYKMPFSENLSHTIIGNGIPTQLTEHVIAPLLTGSNPKFSLKKTNNVKDSRIIPTDVDKSVSSQIEKKYDSAIKEVMNKVAERDKRLVSNYIEQDLSDFSKMRREDINQELKSNENWRRKNLREENREGSTYGITDARHRITEATAERELEYRDVRAKYLSETYGLQGGRQTSLDMVDRAFEDTLGNETNRGELRELYRKARKILVQVGAEFGGVSNAKQEGDLGFAGTDRDISLFIDTMTRTSTPQSELAHTILHEMIHQATVGSINLVKKGMADGMLTSKQIEAVNTIINTYDAYKADRRLVWEEDNYRDYGGKDEYEFAAEMADAKQRRILSIPYGERILNAANELKRVGDISLWQAIKNALRRLFEVSDKSKMDKALSDIMDDFNKNIDDISMNNIEQTDFGLNGNTRFSLRYDQFEHDLDQWKKDNNLPKDAKRPNIPQRNAGESAVDFLRRVDEYRKQMALWKTAPTYEQHLLSDDTALGEFNRELQRGSVLKRIAFQDSMLAIRKAQEAIMKEVGVDRLNMAEDAYTAENRSHGKGKNEFEEYNNEFLQPLRKAYHQMKKVLGDSYDNVRIYMMAKHGLERDAQMAFKKSLEADYEDVAQRSAAYRAYKGDMNRIINDSDLEFGRVDFTTWRQRDNTLKTKYSPSYMNYRYDKMGIVHDYSGLSALFDGSDFEEAAHKLIKDIESKYVTETHNLWDATNAATKKILRDGYKAGMMSKDTYQYVRDMYSHYIPLRGWDGTTADQVWDYIGGGKGGAFNQTLKKAHGRTSIADDPIAYIENMAESGILLNNKNWVKQHLMLLAQNHPTSLLTLSKAWYVKSVDDNGNEEWIPATPQITSQMNSNQVKAAIDAFEQKMEQMAQTGDATQKRDGLNIAYPQTHSEEREHEVRVMKDGEEYVIYVNGDPQLAQAMNNTRAHRVREIQSGKLDRAAAWLGRKMAAAYTSLSPLFIPSNYFRDLTMTLASTAIREDGRYNYLLRKNLATSWNLGFMLRDYQNGKLRDKVSNGNATPKEQMFYDFMMNGGETGFVSSLDVEDLKKKFKNDLKDLNRWKANPVKVGHTIMDGIEFLNRAIEDSNRFAVYMTSIQYGRSIDEAVNDAKDVTLNFNRKGTGEYGWQMIRNLYLFINPAVQSLQTLGALVKHHPFKFTAVTASWLASGVLVPIVNAALMSVLGGDDDKDKYWQFTKWDRRNNLIMWVPFTHEYVKIPLAQEFRAFYGVGDMIASKMMGGELAEESWSQYAEDLLGQVVDMLPLDPTGYDGNIVVSLMPNAVRPIFELAFNVDFTGKPIFKDTEYNKYDPNFTKAYVGTPDWLVRVSKMVNSIGNDYPDVQQNKWDALGNPRFSINNPAVVDHVLSSYLGGAYTMGSQVLGLLTKSLNDPKEIKVADIPLFSKFVSNPDDRPVTKKQGDEFWNMKENHDRAANTLSKLKKQAKVDGDYSMLERFYGSDEYKQYKQDDVKVKKYEEDKKKERAEESGEEYRPHKLNAEDIYKAHATPKDDFEDLKLNQLYTKLNGFKTSYDLLVDTASSQSDGYYNTNKAAIDAIDKISLDKQKISELKKGFLNDGKNAYNAEDMKQIRELRKKILSVLEKANKVVVANQKSKAKKK